MRGRRGEGRKADANPKALRMLPLAALPQNAQLLCQLSGVGATLWLGLILHGSVFRNNDFYGEAACPAIVPPFCCQGKVSIGGHSSQFVSIHVNSVARQRLECLLYS